MYIICERCKKDIKVVRKKKYCSKCAYDRALERHREWYRKNKVYNINRVKEWRKNNLEKVNKSEITFYKKHPNYKKNYIKHYKTTPRYKLLLFRSNSKRRTRKENIIESFTFDEWEKKKGETKGICPVCKENVGIMNLTLDHIIPISKAPKNFIYTIDYIQPICKSCNSSKKDKLTDDAIQLLLEKKIDIKDIEAYRKRRKMFKCKICGIEEYYNTAKPLLCLKCRTKKTRERKIKYSREYNKTYKKKLKTEL